MIDDGSIDDTRAVIQAVADERVRYLWQDNSGLPATRNRGLDEARGEYIALLDSDDIWLPWKLEGQLAVLAGFPRVGMVWTDMAAIDADGRVLRERDLTTRFSAYRYFDRERAFSERRLLERLWPDCPAELSGTKCYAGCMFQWMFMGNLAPDPTVLFTRDRLEATGRFDVSFEGGYEFFLRASRLGDVAFIDAASILCQVGSPDQMSSPERHRVASRDTLAAVQKTLAGGERTLPPGLVRRRLALCYASVGRDEILADRVSARRNLRLALSQGFLVDAENQLRALAWYVMSFLPSGFAVRTIALVRSVRGAGSALRAAWRRRSSAS